MDTSTVGRTYTTEELFGPDQTGATFSTEELFPSAIPKQSFSTEELFGTTTPKIETQPSMRAMTPQERVAFEKESFNVQKQKEVKERYGIFENPKVNYYAEKIAPRLPGWLIGGAGYPVIAGIFEALQQAKNIAMSLKEKSKYDPLAQRQLSEMIPEDSPGWVKALSETGEYASDMVIAAVAGGAIHESVFKRNINKVFEKAEVAGWKGVREKYQPIVEKYGRASTIEEEIKRGIKIGKEEIPMAPGRRVEAPTEGPIATPKEMTITPPTEVITPKAKQATIAPDGTTTITFAEAVKPTVLPTPRVEPSIPDIFMRMPIDKVRDMADQGVEGAKRALVARAKEMVPVTKPPVPQGQIPEKISAPRGEKVPTPIPRQPIPTGAIPKEQMPPVVEELPPYTKEMEEAKLETERIKKETERQRELKAIPRERAPKEIKPLYNFTDIEKEKLGKDITYLTSGSKTPRNWRTPEEKPHEIALRDELITQAYLKLPKMPTPAELKEFVNKKAPYINHEALQTRKEQAEAKVKQFPVTEGEEGRIEYEPSEEASVFGKQEPIETKVSEGKIADDILKEGAAGDERIHEILKARHLQEPESFEALGKRLGMTRGNVHHLYKKGMANLTDPDKMAERVARLKGNEGEKKTEELAKKMDADLGPTKVKAGLSVQMTHPPSLPTKGKPKFAFPEKIEERYQKAKKVPKPTVGEKVGGFLAEARHGITRTYPKLPNIRENVEVKQALKRLEKARSIIADKLVRTNRSMTYKLNADQYDLANRKIIVADLLKEASVGHELPFGFDEATLKDVAPKLNDAIGDDPVILGVIKDRKELWDATRNDYIYWRDKVGHDVTAVLNNSDYFRHSILELMNKKRMVSGMGKKLRKHTGQSFLKKRAGSEMDILSDFLQADHEVLSQMLYDIEEAKTINLIRKKEDISKKLRKEATEKGVPIEDVIPEGYTKWQPKEGHTFYVADTLPAKVAEQILSGEIEDLGVVADNLRKSLAMGRERETWIIRKEVADTLDELKGPQKLTLAGEVFKDINLAWKWSALSLPRRTIKYGLRNVSGDAEHTAVGNPKAFLRVPRAFREMFEVYFGDRPLTGDALIFADKGGLQTTLQVQEIADIPKLPMFRNLYKASKLDDINIFKKYWRAVNKVQNFRESILRYANFIEYKRQMQKNPNGMPDNYGASIPEEIQGLADIDDRAFRLSNEQIGGYDEVSATGQILRRGIYPFWSWPEINTKFYFRMMKNAAYNDEVTLKMGKKMLRGTVAEAKIGIGTTLKIGRFALRAMGLSILLAAYNNIFFPDEEKELPENVRYRAHINFGHDKDGKPVYFSRLGALSDFLQWFGMDAPQAHIADFLNGRKTIKEIAVDMAKSPINVLVSGISPFLKAPFESATRQSLFPDVFKPSKIRDRGLYLARQIGLEDEFRTIMGKPGKPYISTLDQLALYKSDPLETAYYEIRDIRSDWLKKEGKESISFYLNPSSEALYNMKLALRYNEHKLVNKYAEQYAQIVVLRHKGESENAIRKYIKDGITQSLENLHPLSGIKTSERKAFLLSLRPEERDVLVKALRFYNEILIGNSDFKEKD